MNRHDIVCQLEASRDAAIAAYNGPQSDWPKQYAPGKWTVRQLLVHIADVEMVHLWRYSRALAEPGSPVYAFDHDGWVTALRYDERPIEICRDMFTGIRNQIIYYVETMPESTFENTVNHSENGLVPVSRILNYLCYHTEHHLEQISYARVGRVWTPEKS
ncbi:MAG TPA: DinB family protein [Candidatus Hydrogenedentes bacterium]|nr:DinB family protein [Candidatus Hydrogenedentota bacterium]